METRIVTIAPALRASQPTPTRGASEGSGWLRCRSLDVGARRRLEFAPGPFNRAPEDAAENVPWQLVLAESRLSWASAASASCFSGVRREARVAGLSRSRSGMGGPPHALPSGAC